VTKDEITIRMSIISLSIAFISLIFAFFSDNISSLFFTVQISTLAVIHVFSLYVFIFIHGLKTLGKRDLVVFIILAYVISFLAEMAGVHYGLIFGSSYRYNVKLGVKIGGVPISIPGTWMTITYLSFSTVNLIVKPSMRRKMEDRYLIILLLGILAAIDGIATTAWDLIMDPLSGSSIINDVYHKSVLDLWVWTEGGGYFGVPISNFIGWCLVSFTICIIFRIIRFHFGDVKNNRVILYNNVDNKMNLIFNYGIVVAYFIYSLKWCFLAIMANHSELALTGGLLMLSFVFISTAQFINDILNRA